MNRTSQSEQQESLIDDYINGVISEAEFEVFEQQLKEEPELRARLRQAIAIDEYLREDFASQCEVTATWGDALKGNDLAEGEHQTKLVAEKKVTWWPMAVAATLAIGCLVYGLSFFSTTEYAKEYAKKGTESDVAQQQLDGEPPEEDSSKGFAEGFAEGFAVLHELNGNHEKYQVGKTLGAGAFKIEEGAAELHFFCGARVVLEAPAEIRIISAWEAKCIEGRLRAEVPPAARGFKLVTESSEIIDLGTEFALEISDGDATVEVIDGEVAVLHRSELETRLRTGEARYLPKIGDSEARAYSSISPTKNFLEVESKRKESFGVWLRESENLARDERLLAYYNFQDIDHVVPNIANQGDEFSDASIVMATKEDGRWPGYKTALDFRRAGARARVNIPGEFEALTLMAWVRIDSLDRSYSALFMGDGYENGEPHWQIKEDGRLMFSVMIDDSRQPPGNPLSGGIHRVYFSPVIWDFSKSGEWLHLASTYDPEQREVRHFVNGECVHEDTIIDKYYTDTLRIGAGEIGNWGQPFRRVPTFAIRNLNGRIDELGIYGAALGKDEVKEHYLRTKVQF